jgi:hypothetical protein
MLKITKGNGLVRLLNSKFQTSNDDMFPMVDGIEPIRWFVLRPICRSFKQLCKAGGMLPSNWLDDNMSILR